MIHFKRQLAAVIFCAIGLMTGAYGQVILSADAYTNTGNSGTNYGTNALLDVQSGSQVTYIQFNLGSIPASTGAFVGSYPAGTNPIGIAFDGTNIWVAKVSETR